MKDWVTGEEVVYTYDKLNRLTSAATTGDGWGQAYVYDGFGNLREMTKLKGDAPNTMTVLVDGATNRITSQYFSYAYNRTALTMPSWQGTYDNEGRLTDVTQTQNGTESYEYDPWNHRVWSTQPTTGIGYGTTPVQDRSFADESALI